MNGLIEKYQKSIQELFPGKQIELFATGGDTYNKKILAKDFRITYDIKEKGLFGALYFSLYIGNVQSASWTFSPFPGCCGILVSTSAYVVPSFQGKGLGSLLNNLRKDLTKEFGYSCLVCTDNIDNIPQRKILRKNGFNDLKIFKNSRTGNTLAISCYEVI